MENVIRRKFSTESFMMICTSMLDIRYIHYAWLVTAALVRPNFNFLGEFFATIINSLGSHKPPFSGCFASASLLKAQRCRI